MRDGGGGQDGGERKAGVVAGEYGGGTPCKLTCASQGRVFEFFAVPRVVATDKDDVTVEVSAASAALMKILGGGAVGGRKELPPYPSVE